MPSARDRDDDRRHPDPGRPGRHPRRRRDRGRDHAEALEEPLDARLLEALYRRGADPDAPLPPFLFSAAETGALCWSMLDSGRWWCLPWCDPDAAGELSAILERAHFATPRTSPGCRVHLLPDLLEGVPADEPNLEGLDREAVRPAYLSVTWFYKPYLPAATLVEELLARTRRGQQGGGARGTRAVARRRLLRQTEVQDIVLVTDRPVTTPAGRAVVSWAVLFEAWLRAHRPAPSLARAERWAARGVERGDLIEREDAESTAEDRDAPGSRPGPTRPA